VRTRRAVRDVPRPQAFPLTLRRATLFNSAGPIVENVPSGQDRESPVGQPGLPKKVAADGPLSSHRPGIHPSLHLDHASLDPVLGGSVRDLLPLLKAQGSHYITAHIHARPYLLTVGDTLRLPFQMSGVVPGDILRLNRASNIGSRDITLRGTPYIDERLFECRARVMGVEAEPMRIKEKTKRRQRRVKTVRSKHRFTVLKVSELRVNLLEDIGT
jgi:large subunit ribosomal protein L21